MTLTIALVAGEDSGDQLGAPLISDLKNRFPGCRLVGVGGERMRAAGLEPWWDCSELAHFGLFEVLSHLGRIWKLRKDLLQRLLELKPDVFIGIDAPDFNLGLEKRLKAAGIRTVHYVSPTVWAWRAWRIPKIRSATDLVLCLFPFEPDFLAAHQIKAAYVGHPLADQIDPVPDPGPARSALGIGEQGPVITLLPGSRQSEVERLAAPMLGAAHLLKERFPNAQFIVALANSRVAARFREQLEAAPGLEIEMVEGRVREVIAAGDVVVCASGTATLETMLIDRPMVMVYSVAASTYHLVRVTRMIKAKRFSLPNILAGEDLVPELTQKQVTAQDIARETTAWLDDGARRKAMSEDFRRMHATLRCNASNRAAREVARLLEER